MQPITEAKFLTDDERARLGVTLARYPTARDTLLIQLILFTGSRSCEVVGGVSPDGTEVGVRFRDFTWKESAVTIRGAKGSNNRTVPLPAEFCRRLMGFIELERRRNPDELVFSISTRQLRHIWDQYRPCQKGIHCLRHTAGVLLYLNCRDINIVRAFLGHRNINNTMVYLDFVEGVRRLRQAAKGMWNQQIFD